MMKNHIHKMIRRVFTALLAVALLMAPDIFALNLSGQALEPERNVDNKISLQSLIIRIDNAVIYDSAKELNTPSVSLTPDSTMSFALQWDVKSGEDSFKAGDYFSIPVVKIDGLRLTEPFVQPLELDAGNGQKVAVAEGRFTYAGGLLSFDVIFNEKASGYRIEGGPAGGYAGLSLQSGQTELPMTFDDNQTIIVDVDTGPGGVLPGLPIFPPELPKMSKALFSPDIISDTVNLMARYATIPPSGERKFGLDWRMTFFDLDSYFQSGGDATTNVIIEDVVGEGQEFSNFDHFASSGRDKGFDTVYDEDYEAPFFIEIPIVAVGSNRIYNLYGGDTLPADSRNGYIGTIIRATQLERISGSDVEARVRSKPLSWGIEKLSDGREKLIINIGKLGPGVKKGEGLTVDMVKEKDYPYTVLDNVIVKELLSAQRMIELDSPDVNQWKRVRKESLNTILHYWPGYHAKLCGIANIPADSGKAALEDALFSMKYDQLSQSGIASLGSDAKHGIAQTMRIDGFVLRYRTVLASVTGSDISNNAKITTNILTREAGADYSHKFYASIFGTVNVGEIAFIKADEADGHISGETDSETIQSIQGLAGAEFELYEESGGTPPLRLVRNGSSYELREGGDVLTIRSDADGAFKITGLSPSKSYALYEKAAPDGYLLPAQRNTVFQVSGSESRYFIITNKKEKKDTTDETDKTDEPGGTGVPGTTRESDLTDISDDPTATGKPDNPGTRRTSDTPDTRNMPDTDVPLTNVNVPQLGDNNKLHIVVPLMLLSVLVIAGLLLERFIKSARNSRDG